MGQQRRSKIRAFGESVLVRIYECESRIAAANREYEEISFYGRRCDGSGILTNILPGGEGGAGGSPFLDPLEREMLREFKLEKRPRGWHLVGNKNLLGYKHSEEAKRKIGDSVRERDIEYSPSELERRSQRASERNKTFSLAGRTLSESHKEKLSRARKLRNSGLAGPTQKERRAAKKLERQRKLDELHN